MFHSRLVTTFALLLVLAYALPALCVAAPLAATPRQTPVAPCGSCHGHHQHMPTPQRYCCANPQAPAALQASASPTQLKLIGYRQAEELADHSGFVAATSIDCAEHYPPPPAVLRI